MLVSFRCRIVVLIAVLVLGLAHSAAAQRKQRPMPQQPMAMPITFSGTVQQMRGGSLQVTTAMQEGYVVKLEPRRTKVQCSGTAEADFLRPGLYIRFSGEFDQRGNSKSDLSELAVVTLSDAVRLGIQADNPAGGLQDAPKKKAKNEGGSFVVVGQIRSIKNGQLLVTAPGVSGGLKVNLAEAATINVEVGDVSLAQQGDEIDVQGSLVQAGQNGQPGLVVASEVTIKLAKPLTALSKKKVTRTPATARGKKADDGSEKSEKGAKGEKALSGNKAAIPAFGKAP